MTRKLTPVESHAVAVRRLAATIRPRLDDPAVLRKLAVLAQQRRAS